MLRATPTLQKMASTHGGMRRILKKRLPVHRYIELAVKAGSYKSPSTRPNYLGMHDVGDSTGRAFLSPREREERLKLRRGVIDFPTEYEILSLNPPLPTPPRTPVRVRKRVLNMKRQHLAKLKKERRKKGITDDADLSLATLPSMDRLVKSYLSRHEDKLRKGMSPSASKREEEYYSNLLLGSNAEEEAEKHNEKFRKIMNPSSLTTAMGRKSMLVENAYAFALRQQQVMLDGKEQDLGNKKKVMTEEESVEEVERLLREDARANRRKGREAADEVGEWRMNKKDEEDAGGEKGGSKGGGGKDDNASLPSILHERPRAIQALNIWSARLQSIPYSRWTIGASTALDHWIAREILQMDESTWRQVLEGGGTDAYSEGFENNDMPGGESRRGLTDRMRDIVVVRGALFPETLRESSGDVVKVGGRELAGDLDSDEDGGGGDINATEKSIDDLLASLGDFDDDDDESAWRFDDEDDDKKKEEEKEDGVGDAGDEQLTLIMDDLQVWRGRNASSPYDAWDADRKSEFDEWIDKYVATLYPEADPESVDKEATRMELLAERPLDSEKTKEFWSKVRTEEEADIFLRDFRTSAREKLQSLKASPLPEDKATQAELEAILSVPYDDQLQKLVTMGTLRPILDDYAPGSERKSFFEKYTPIFLEGLEMEHLVPDPDGPIGLDDLTAELREELSSEWTPEGGLAAGGGGGAADDGRGPRFSIRMVAYGTDEYGTSRAERARELYRLWNEHKTNRARFEEALFKRGHLGLEEDGAARFKRKEKKDKK